VYSPSHDLDVKRKGPRHVICSYEVTNAIPTTDFVVYYKAANEKIGAKLLTHQPEAGKDGYFMLLVSPNPRDAAEAIMPKDVVVVFDHSGSMGGQKMAQTREAVGHILKKLNKEDRFNVIAYNDQVDPFFDGLAAVSKKNISEAQDRLDRVQASGGTNIHGALLKGLEFCKATRQDRPAYVLFMTDGLPTVGKTDEGTILKDVEKAAPGHVRLFSFGVGYDANVRLLDKLSQANSGRSDYVKPNEPVERKISSLYNKIKNPVMTDITSDITGLKLRDMYPREVGDLFDGDQLVLVGRYDCDSAKDLPRREQGVHHTQLVIKGRYRGETRAFEYPVTVRPAGRDSRFEFVEKLWAIRRVGYLLDQIQLHGQSKELTDEVIRLSREYGIMTPYTAFLADETARGARPEALRSRLNKAAEPATTGAWAQMGGAARKQLAEADRAAPAGAERQA
jgi:Ca-activated chloride channel family protein